MIVVFGSLVVDMLKRVERFPRPGETVLCPDYQLVPGGKGANQAVAAARASATGMPVHMIGTVGSDAFADQALSVIDQSPVDTRYVTLGSLPTAVASIGIVPSGENSIVLATGANRESRADQVPDDLLGPDTWLLLQLEVTVEENWTLMERAKARGARVVLNAAPTMAVPEEAIARCDYLIVNEIEATAVAGGETDAIAAARSLYDRHGITTIVTLGPGGARAFSADGHWSVGTLDIDALDSTGAGDAFVGTLTAALAEGADLPDAMRLGSVGGGLACLKVGCQTAFAGRAEIDRRSVEMPAATRID